MNARWYRPERAIDANHVVTVLIRLLTPPVRNAMWISPHASHPRYPPETRTGPTWSSALPWLM